MYRKMANMQGEAETKRKGDTMKQLLLSLLLGVSLLVAGCSFKEPRFYTYPEIKALAQQHKTKAEIKQELGRPESETDSFFIYRFASQADKKQYGILIMFDQEGRSYSATMRPAHEFNRKTGGQYERSKWIGS